MTVLMAASNQWANRPADQRFKSLADLDAAVRHHREVAAEAPSLALSSLSISTQEYTRDGAPPVVEPVLISNAGSRARFTHFSFGQFAKRVSAPASYLRTLSPGLAASNLNYGLRSASERDEPTNKLLLAQNGELVVRAVTSDSYTRIWNYEITKRLIRLSQETNFQPAPEAFDGSRGLYASDKDIFCFLVDNDRRIFETGPGGGLGRGFFVSNSEVGDASFRLTTFWYEYVCGNHRVWGAQGVSELRIPHIGNADDRAFSRMAVELKRYADSSATEDEAKVASMHKMTLGGTRDELIDRVFGLGVPKRLAAQAYDRADEQSDRYGSPRSVWGFTGGLTEIARDLPNADARVEMDRLAGKVMQVAF